MREAGIPVGVGADGAPCNNRLDAFQELRLAVLLQQLRHGPDAFCGLDALRLATSEGARAIGLEDEVGSLEVGKAGDLLVLRSDRPELWAGPAADLHDLVAYCGSRAAVRHVLVEGEPLVEEGALTRLDLTQIARRARLELDRLVARSVLASELA